MLIKMNGISFETDKEMTILQVSQAMNINIPTLCYHPDLSVRANCRVCLVEVEGMKQLQTACNTHIHEGMVIETNNERVRQARKTIVEMILANHDSNCTTCHSNGKCELQGLTEILNIRHNPYDNVLESEPIMKGNPSIVRDMNKCIKCGRCIEVCNEVQKVGAIYNIGRGKDMRMGPAYDYDLSQVQCTYCGQCINVCPVGAIYEQDDVKEVLACLESDKQVIVQVAPSIRVSLGECFGMTPGTLVTGKIPAVLRKIGFDKVFDTNFTADLTILEEGTEFLSRLNNNGVLPMLTSCSPGWINYIEQFYPELLDHLSTCKSPQQMFGALAKTYYAEKINVEPEDMVVVSIMPCTAKKYEAKRPEMSRNGVADVDYVLTTRELARLIKVMGYDLDVADEAFDAPFGITSGAGLIFGASGGVMEAALRSVYEIVTGEELLNLDFHDVRGLTGIKEAVVTVGQIDVKIAVSNSLVNARQLLDKIKSGQADYHFIEVMCCPGGCIGGGGQPRPTTNIVKLKRMEGIYAGDRNMALRKSHNNPAVKALYDEFLIEANGQISHQLLHTHYTDRQPK